MCVQIRGFATLFQGRIIFLLPNVLKQRRRRRTNGQAKAINKFLSAAVQEVIEIARSATTNASL